MSDKEKRCSSCSFWRPDGGGWGRCLNALPCQDVVSWSDSHEETFKTFGCVYHSAKTVKSNSKKEIEE